jgi:hypothetical protein
MPATVLRQREGQHGRRRQISCFYGRSLSDFATAETTALQSKVCSIIFNARTVP